MMDRISHRALDDAVYEALKNEPSRPGTYHIVTMGCQMNVRDSEIMAGALERAGLTYESERNKADLILYNTCAVRENAENKALGNVIWLKELKAQRPEILIAVTGCMMQEPGMAERVLRQYPFIDLAFGTHNEQELPALLLKKLQSRRRVVEVWDAPDGIHEDMPERRNSPFQHFVTVMYGCNNFCSYCIVPYVRGRERSRSPEDILDEMKRLQDRGAKEITLLGQNVNSYGGGGDQFARLLRRADDLGVERIRFMTSHPKDMSDELISCFGELKHLCPQLHLPVQAGNDRVLKEMNRRYTREKYMGLVEKLRKVCPDIGLTTDIIVGFPTETYGEFRETVDLMETVRYDAAFTFVYSPRPGTKAAAMPDPVSAAEKSQWIQELIAVQQRITGEICAARVGEIVDVLVEGESARGSGSLGGKTPRGHMVNFPGSGELIGKIIPVRIVDTGKNTLRGEYMGSEV